MHFSDFITAWEGKWLSQRTSFNFDQNQAANAKSDVTVARLPITDGGVQTVAALLETPLTDEWTVLQLTWELAGDWGKPKQVGSIYYGFNDQTGQLWRGTAQPHLPLLKGHFHLGSDDCLTLTFQGPDTRLTERHWYASPNLRLRTSLIRRGEGYRHSAFYSDIRRLPPAEKAA